MNKFRMKHASLVAGILVAASAMTMSGCVSGNNHSTIEAIEGVSKAQPHPFVEGFIEYGGPQAKWAGPSSFMIHVLAKDAGPAQISITPELYNDIAPPGLTMGGRTPASAEGMSSESAREHLGLLAVAIQNGGEQDFRGCLSPVRVRLIRSDGSLVEKQGCRSHTGWPRATSEMVNNLILAKIYGVNNKAPVMSVPAPAAPSAGVAPAAQAVAPAATTAVPAAQAAAPAGHEHENPAAKVVAPAATAQAESPAAKVAGHEAAAPAQGHATAPAAAPATAQTAGHEVVPAAGGSTAQGHGYAPTDTAAVAKDGHKEGQKDGHGTAENRAPASAPAAAAPAAAPAHAPAPEAAGHGDAHGAGHGTEKAAPVDHTHKH